MKKSKIIVSASILDAVVDSNALCEQEKLKFLRYVGYMSREEQKELVSII